MNTEPAVSVRSRTPNGCSERISMQVSAAERAEIERIAFRESRSVSSVARLIFLEGMRVRRQAGAEQ